MEAKNTKSTPIRQDTWQKLNRILKLRQAEGEKISMVELASSIIEKWVAKQK